MLGLLLLAATQPLEISRDNFGVPHITAKSAQEAFFFAGYACAQDRLDQMQSSAVLARGMAAKYLGNQYVSADKEQIKGGYTEEELTAQLKKTSPMVQMAIQNYTRGVNSYIEQLPDSEKNPLRTRKWSEVDSVAIAIRLLQYFGRGGAGEVRNWALYSYLKARPNIKDNVNDIFNSLLWQNEPRATTTVADSDWGSKPIPKVFPPLTNEVLEKSYNALPKVNLLELIPLLRAEQHQESTLVAETLAAPFKTGSYAIVVSENRSKTGFPILLSAPQMGHTVPSIVHEMSIKTPEFEVAGMDIPGVPGIVIGHTNNLAWGLTTGVADTEDFAYGKAEIKTIEVPYQAGPDAPVETVTIERGYKGYPVVMKKPEFQMVRASSFWNRELLTMDSIYGLYTAKSHEDIDKALTSATLNFNFFYALKEKGIGYRYTGKIPVRKEGADPRLPIPFEKLWTEEVPFSQMPHVRNPKSGLLANWNNKPISWWPNGDTPVWGVIFRDKVLRNLLTQSKIGDNEIEFAVSEIAKTNNTFWAFKPLIDSTFGLDTRLNNFNGKNIEGSKEAVFFESWVQELRRELFAEPVGNLMSPEFFNIAIQPSVILNALQKRTPYDYLQGRSPQAVMIAASMHVEGQGNKSGFAPGTLRGAPGTSPILYNDRGTYIQIINLDKEIRGRNVLNPGVSMSGPHAWDQNPLARYWQYKPMRF